MVSSFYCPVQPMTEPLCSFIGRSEAGNSHLDRIICVGTFELLADVATDGVGLIGFHRLMAPAISASVRQEGYVNRQYGSENFVCRMAAHQAKVSSALLMFPGSVALLTPFCFKGSKSGGRQRVVNFPPIPPLDFGHRVISAQLLDDPCSSIHPPKNG